MKKIIYLAVLLTGFVATAATPPDISEKVLKAFKQTFTSAENVSWKEFDNTNCEAIFKQSEITIRALYDKDGNLLETVRTYGSTNLPANILAKFTKKYSGKEIFGVTEISSDNDVAYYVMLKDSKNWYIVKSDPYANLQQTDKFRRGEIDLR